MYKSDIYLYVQVNARFVILQRDVQLYMLYSSEKLNTHLEHRQWLIGAVSFVST